MANITKESFMANLSPVDQRVFEHLLQMQSGFVLDFSDRTFAQFFRQTTSIDINHEKYQTHGTSKAKRLRAFWEVENDSLVGIVLIELLKLWDYLHASTASDEDKKKKATALEIASKLAGEKTAPKSAAPDKEDEISSFTIAELNLSNLKIDPFVIPIIEKRLTEIEKCLNNNAPLAAIILAGSVLEAALLGLATTNHKNFNQAQSAAKDRLGKVLPVHDWKLNSLIDAAHELGYIKLDVKKFGHSLRDFRNFIHPNEQLLQKFEPDTYTAKIGLQVLLTALADLTGRR